MLERLDDVAWGDLRHAYGEASDVPSLIRGLTSSDKAQRDQALYELFGNIWHQGTVYEATVHALPFLIDILADPQTPDREGVAHLVASVLSGNGYYLVHARLGASLARVNVDEEMQKEREVVSAIRSQGTKAIPLLVPYLSDAHPEVRAAIAGALGCLAEPDNKLAHVLRKALESERDEFVRDAIIESLEHQAGRSSA